MKKRSAQNLNQLSKQVNQNIKESNSNMADVGEKLLKGESLSLDNIRELGHRVAEKEGYANDQLIVCSIKDLKDQLTLRKPSDILSKLLFVICSFDDDERPKAVFCILKLPENEHVVSLYKDFVNKIVPDNIKQLLEQSFDTEIEFKVNFKSNEIENKKDQDILSLQTLKTLMVQLKTNEKNKFIDNFADPKRSYFGWLKIGIKLLKDELFSLVKEGYYKTLASDIDQLSRETEFKKAIKEVIDNIPLLDQLDHFKNYQRLLKEFVKLEDDEVDDITLADKMKKLEQAKEKAFDKTKNVNVKTTKTENNRQQLEIVQKFPEQMAKFTKIFEPLVRSEVDENLDKELKEISEKLDLDYNKLKSFFQAQEETKQDETKSDLGLKNIQEVIQALPKSKRVYDTDTSLLNKPFDKIISEIKASPAEIKSLEEGYVKVKSHFEQWKSKDGKATYNWAVAKKGQLRDDEIFEAISVIDRANELVTAGHRLRDTQILSVLSFLIQKDKGVLSQIQTGEGKTTIVAILAAIKVLQGELVDIVTSNPVLAVDAVKEKKLFFSLLAMTAETNNLDENYKSGERDCYKADIVYGNISNFQFDFLKDSFLGLGTRAGRTFDNLVLDEVDSMIIDNASHIAKLAGPLPGMESLKYIHIKIWQELCKAEERIVEDFQKQLKAKAKELKKLSINEHEAQAMYENFENELKGSILPKMTEYIKASNPTKIDIIPSHVQQYADNTLDKWINSAINAKFSYNEDEQYVIRVDEKSGEKVIQPIDYANTGITLKNTIWQYGLHQFLQLKHNLQLTSENLTSCFISNLGYINKYGSKIYGLTGTLGSEAEQNLLSSIYNVTFTRIPTYREKKFIEIEGEVVADEIFNEKVADDARLEISNGRSSLIICETIKDAKAIQKVLQENFESISIRVFFDEDNAHVTEKEIKPGEVVIATNIAGRGTDFKTTIELEKHGGLQVCVAFLPCNKRVEDQAFGRTARQGNNGTAKLIIKKSEVEKLGINSTYFPKIKAMRDRKEAERIRQIQEVKLLELRFQDRLFEIFSDLFKKLKDEDRTTGKLRYVLDDLKEYWAFWLEKNNFKGQELKDKNPEDEFKKFEELASDIINGDVKFNPYYSIQQAEHFITNEKFDDAEKSLKHALEISKNPEILHSAYIKFFEISIERGRVIIDKFRKALGDIFLIEAIEPDREYKEKAKDYLRKAKEAFKIELDYIENLCNDNDFSNILTSDEANESNLFLKHIISKQIALDVNMQHAESLIQQIDKQTGGVAINGRTYDYFANLKPKTDQEKTLKENLYTSELSELAAIGTNTTYAIREVHDVCPEIVTGAQIQIGGGITLIATGICFPPALPVTSSIGGTMITEGICDVAIELINKASDGNFNKAAYIKGKVISYGISLLTLGINAALQCPKILEKAKKACRWLSATLRKCPFLKGTCEFLATKIDKLGNWFEKMEALAKFNQMSKIEKLKYVDDLNKTKDLKTIGYLGENINQINGILKELNEFGKLAELTHLQNCVNTLRQVAITVGVGVTKRCMENVIMTKVVTPAVSSLMEGLKPKIKEHVQKSVNDNIDKEKLKYSSFDEVQATIKNIRDSIDLETVKDIFKETILGMTKYCSNWKVQLGALAFDQYDSWQKVYNYAKDLCKKINEKLISTSKKIQNNVDELINQLVEQFTEEMFNQLVSTTIKSCRDIYNVGKSAYENYKRDKRLRDLCLEINRSFKEGGMASQEQARALSDVTKRRIEIHEENGNVIVLGEQYPGEPIKVSYFPPDEQNPDGHYVPYGKDKNWSLDKNTVDNNCLFDAVGSQITGADPGELRENTIKKIESNPQDYIAPHARDIFDLQLFLEGGRKPMQTTERHYPSIDGRIEVSEELKPVLADFYNILNEEYDKCEKFDEKGGSSKLREINKTKSMPQVPQKKENNNFVDKTEMMMGALEVEFTDGTKLKLLTVSGDFPLSFRKSMDLQNDGTFNTEPIPFKPQGGNAKKSTGEINGFKFVDPGFPEGKVYDVYNHQDTRQDYTKSCAAQKLFYSLSQHMKAHPDLEVKGNIKMAESWYEKRDPNVTYKPYRIKIEPSCAKCETTLPFATGLDRDNYN